MDKSEVDKPGIQHLCAQDQGFYYWGVVMNSKLVLGIDDPVNICGCFRFTCTHNNARV